LGEGGQLLSWKLKKKEKDYGLKKVEGGRALSSGRAQAEKGERISPGK